MRIGVDARELTGRPTGVGRYLHGLLREWSSHGNGHEFLLFAHRPLSVNVAGMDVRLLPGNGGTAWEQLTLARASRRERLSVLFSPAYSTPLWTSVPRVVALHDVSFAARPEWYAGREGFRRRLLARRSIVASRAIITISEFSKQEIVRLFGAAPADVCVVPPGIDRPIAAEPAAAEPDAAKPRSLSVLYVGSIFARRHIPDLIRAFERVAARQRGAVLHLVGDNRSFPFEDLAQLIAGSAAASQIVWHRYVSEDELQRLYASARAFAFLSEYEGLGLTPLEALSVGVPPLLLDTDVARESCGQSALYVPLGDIDATARELERLLLDEGTRNRLLASAPATLARYDWKVAARDTLAVLTGAA